MTSPTSTSEATLPALITRLRDALSGGPAGELDASFAGRFPLAVLVVEDNKLNLKVAQGLLARLGYVSDAAANGVEAIQATARKRYDVVLMDVQMPVMDGIAATRQICARFGATAPRVIAMTAAESAGERRECAAVGMSGWVAKPVRLEALAEALSAGGAAPPTGVVDLAALATHVARAGEAQARAELAIVLGRAESAVARIVRACDGGNAGLAAAACAELDASATRVGVARLAARVRELAQLVAADAPGEQRAAAARSLADAAREAQALAAVVLDPPSRPSPST